MYSVPGGESLLYSVDINVLELVFKVGLTARGLQLPVKSIVTYSEHFCLFLTHC